MKRLTACILILVCIALLFVGCTRPPVDDPAMDVPKQPQPAQPEPSLDPAEPSTDSANPDPTEPPAPSLPEGTPLTEEEIAWFNTYFFTDEWVEWDDLGPEESTKLLKSVNIHNQFLFQAYDSPENIDLALLFFQGFSLSEYPTDEEKIAVHEMLGMQWDPEPGCSIELFRVPRENMEAAFLENTGLTIEQTQKVGMDRTDYYYLEETDAYYHSHGPFAYDCFIVSEGVKLDDGTVALRYYRPRSEETSEGIVTLMPHEDTYWFVSNLHIS